jgi:hypothetical protein
MGLYKLVGLVLIIIGLGLILLAYFSFSAISIIVGGLSTVILGFTCVCLGFAPSNISPKASQLLLKTGIQNVSSILESFEIKNKAIYFPKSSTEADPQALIPLSGYEGGREYGMKTGANSLIRLMPNSNLPAMAVTTAGNLSLSLLQNAPSGTDEIKPTLKKLLTRELGVAAGIKVYFKESRINVEVKEAEIKYEGQLSDLYLGSPIASIVAAVSSEALKRPIRIIEENNHRNNIRIALEVLS